MKKIIKSLISGTINVRLRAWSNNLHYFIDDMIGSDNARMCCCRHCCC